MLLQNRLLIPLIRSTPRNLIQNCRAFVLDIALKGSSHARPRRSSSQCAHPWHTQCPHLDVKLWLQIIKILPRVQIIYIYLWSLTPLDHSELTSPSPAHCHVDYRQAIPRHCFFAWQDKPVSILDPLDGHMPHKGKAKMISKKLQSFIQKTALTKSLLLFQENLRYSMRCISPMSCIKYE